MNDKELILVIEAARQADKFMPTIGCTSEDEDAEIKLAISKAFIVGVQYAKDNPQSPS